MFMDARNPGHLTKVESHQPPERRAQRISNVAFLVFA
jgi:hypothetical protein